MPCSQEVHHLCIQVVYAFMPIQSHQAIFRNTHMHQNDPPATILHHQFLIHLPYNLKMFERDRAACLASFHQTSLKTYVAPSKTSWSVQMSITQAHTGRSFPPSNTHCDAPFDRLNMQFVGFCGSEFHAVERHPCIPWWLQCGCFGCFPSTFFCSLSLLSSCSRASPMHTLVTLFHHLCTPLWTSSVIFVPVHQLSSPFTHFHPHTNIFIPIQMFLHPWCSFLAPHIHSLNPSLIFLPIPMFSCPSK